MLRLRSTTNCQRRDKKRGLGTPNVNTIHELYLRIARDCSKFCVFQPQPQPQPQKQLQFPIQCKEVFLKD